jgi:hypothetical protein
MKRNAGLLALLLLAGLSPGCVTRRFVITSDPMGAMVYKDGQPIGPTPVEQYFVYYGKYKFRLVKDGYEPLDVEADVATPWYEIPGLDFFSENVCPYKYWDVQRFHYQLTPQQAVRPDDVRRRGQELRDRGKAIGTPPPGGLLPIPPGPAPPAPPLLAPPERLEPPRRTNPSSVSPSVPAGS